MGQYGTRDSIVDMVRDLVARVRRLEARPGRSLFDRAGNVTVADDATSGQGLSRPHVPVVFTDAAVTPTARTNDTNWAVLQVATAVPKQHPRLTLQVLVQADAGTTGEVRVWNSSAAEQIGDTVTVAAGSLTLAAIGPDVVSGAHMAETTLQVQGRVTSGSGYVGAAVNTAYGIGS